MKSDLTVTEPYLRFMHFRDAIIPNNIDRHEWSLLEYIYKEDSLANRVRVSDIMLLLHIASSSTLHTKLMKLKHDGYVQIASADYDERVKLITLTQETRTIFISLNRCLARI